MVNFFNLTSLLFSNVSDNFNFEATQVSHVVIAYMNNGTINDNNFSIYYIEITNNNKTTAYIYIGIVLSLSACIIILYLLLRMHLSRGQMESTLAHSGVSDSEIKFKIKQLLTFCLIEKYKLECVKFHENNCSICLNGFIKNQKIHIIKACGHIFHYKCLLQWIKSNIAVKVVQDHQF